MTRRSVSVKTVVGLCLGLLLPFASISRASDFGVRVIAHPTMPVSEISADDLRSIFLLTKTMLNGHRVEPVLDAGMLRVFSSECLGKTDQALEIYYRSLVFAGKGVMPMRLGSSAEVVAHVARTPGAIGYVSEGTQLAGVKTLRIR
jgi:hypothetical protein